MKELWSLARDVSVAVGAYVGMVRDRFWAELSNGDGFDERLARAKAEFAADRLADKEEAEEVAEPDDLWEPDELWRLPPDHPTRLEMEMLLADALSRNNTSAPGVFPSPGSDSSSRQSAQGAVEEPRVATGPPHGTPGRSSNQPPVPPSGPSTSAVWPPICPCEGANCGVCRKESPQLPLSSSELRAVRHLLYSK